MILFGIASDDHLGRVLPGPARRSRPGQPAGVATAPVCGETRLARRLPGPVHRGPQPHSRSVRAAADGPSLPPRDGRSAAPASRSRRRAASVGGRRVDGARGRGAARPARLAAAGARVPTGRPAGPGRPRVSGPRLGRLAPAVPVDGALGLAGGRMDARPGRRRSGSSACTATRSASRDAAYRPGWSRGRGAPATAAIVVLVFLAWPARRQFAGAAGVYIADQPALARLSRDSAPSCAGSCGRAARSRDLPVHAARPRPEKRRIVCTSRRRSARASRGQ